MLVCFFAGDEGGGCLPGGHFGAACFVLEAVIVFAYQFGKLLIESSQDGQLGFAEREEPGFGGRERFEGAGQVEVVQAETIGSKEEGVKRGIG